MTLAVTVGAGAAAAMVASLGTSGLYAALGTVGLAVLAYVLRNQLIPVFDDALGRARRVGGARTPGTESRLGTLVLVLGASLLAIVFVTAGTKAAIAAAVVPLVAAGLWLAWPLINELILRPPEDLDPRPHSPDDATGSRSADGSPTERRVGARGVGRQGVGTLGVAVMVLSAGGIGFLAAGLGLKGLIVAVGATTAGAAYLLVQDRSTFGMFAATVSLTFVLHKSLSAQDLNVSGGAISIFVTTFDMMLLGLYGLWMMEGTIVADLRAGMRRRVMWLPLLGASALLPSLLVSKSPLLGFAELTRMGWMYLLFVYAAIRVRTRRQVEVILLGLGVFAAVEVVVILLQWRTGGVLGLSFLGVPTELGERVTDTGSLGRPFGTIIHPVFMGATMSAVGLLALSVALARKNGLARTFAWLTVVGALGAMYVAHTRAAMVAAVLVGLGVVAHAWRRGDVTTIQLRRVAMVGLACAIAALPLLIPKFEENFGTGHFFEEVNSRQQLNVIGFQMWEDHSMVGVGLNNFEQVMGPYEEYGAIFFNNPVHNLYLLYLAETGLVGLVGLMVTSVAVVVPGFRASRSRDPLYASVGRGVVAVVVFFAVEELLGFSLRQDIPLAMLWLMAGLAIAALNLTERAGPSLHRPSRWGQARRVAMATPRPTERSARPVNEVAAARAIQAVARWMGILAAWPRSFRRPVRRLLSRVLPGVMAVGLLGLVVVSPSSVAASAEADVQLVFSATERSTGQTGIYVAGSDRRPRRLTPADGRFYSWPEFAPGSRRIVYTARSGPPGSPTSIYEVSADGGPPTLIRSFEFEVAQPKISPDGTVLLFSATAPWFRLVGLYSMDLATGDVTNLSTVTQPNGASDADPVFSADGESIVFADNKYDSTQIARLARDGTSRKLLTSDRYYNVDPDLSGDEARIAYSSYRGTGGPFTRAGDQLSVKVEGWQLVSSPVAGTGSVLALTQGQNCTVRDPSIRCSPAETSAFRPRYSPDGDSIGFVGALDSLSNCICAIGTDGRDPQVVLESVDLAIDWFDWAPDRAASAPRPLSPPAPQPFDRALLVVQGNDDTTQVVSASPDFLDQHELPLPPGYDALIARWGRNDEVIFSARADLGVAAAVPHPAPPMGAQRRTHFTFDQLDPGRKSEDHQVDIAEQLFLRRADGTVERLTDPYTEDWRDGLPDGDARSNGQPRVSPDGSTVFYTSTSRLTGESFVMSLSLRTGEVLNLTNGTSGAALVDDQHPSLSADGRRLAFTFTDGWNDVWAMDATTGFNADPITDDEWTDSSPVFTVDGASVVYSSYRGSGSGVTVDADGSVKVRPQGWVLVRRDLNSNTETLLSGSSQPSALQPEVDPSGMWVYFLSLTPTGPRIARVPRDGTAAPSIVTGDTRAHRSVDLR